MTKKPAGDNIFFIRGDGGIGRHASLRCWWSNPWLFKSASPQRKAFEKIGSLFYFRGKIMIAVFVNCGAIILGSLIGVLFSKRINEKLTDAITLVCGAVTFVMGIQMSLKYQNVVYLTLSLVFGGLAGTAVDIDGKILLIGKYLGKIFGAAENSNANPCEVKNPAGKTDKNFAYAFLNSSVLFCVGAMAIVGSFKAGISHDYSIIFLKSTLDGFLSIGMAASLGIGTMFSALAIFVYQGILTLLSTLIEPYVSEQMIKELTACGGVMIIFIGFNIMKIKSIKTANYLPAVVFTVLFVLLDPFIKNLLKIF